VHRYTVITLFPQLVQAFRECGIVRRACAQGLIDIEAINPRLFADDRRGTVDDSPYGGGPGMVLLAAPVRAAIALARARQPARVVYLTPQGRTFRQRDAKSLAVSEHLVLLAGRYEGIDERVIARDVDEEWSIGDFVLSGGELPALMLIDAVVRQLPGVLGDPESAMQDSFSDGLLDCPHYTRPEVLDDDAVPGVLLSGDHAAIKAWRRRQQLIRTWSRRPDLLAGARLDDTDRAVLAELAAG
jgi:tRNA (guanine37-N1)-methyltransferase